MKNSKTVSIGLVRKECKECMLVKTCENKYVDGTMGLADIGLNENSLSATVGLTSPVEYRATQSLREENEMDVMVDISKKEHVGIEQFNKIRMKKMMKKISKLSNDISR